MSTHNMITVKGIEQIILILVDADPELKSARQYGEFRANNRRADEYPVLFYEFAQGDMTQTQPGKWNREITMALGVAIQLLEGRINELDMKSRAVSILEKTVLKLRASSEFAAVGVRFPEKNISISNLEETGDDLITGVFTNIKFVLPVVVCEDDLPYLPLGTQANTYTPTAESSLFCSLINDCPTIEEMQTDIALLFTLTGGTSSGSTFVCADLEGCADYVAVSATTYQNQADIIALSASSVVATYVQPGVNIYTGGTESRPIVGVIGSPSFTSVTASNFISGSTNLSDLFAPTIHTHVSSAITDASYGGFGSADFNKLAKFNLEGQLKASVTNSTTGAIWGNSTGTGYAGFFDAASVNAALKVNNGGSGTGVEAESSNGYGADIVSLNSAALRVHAIDLSNTDSDIAHFYESLVAALRLTILHNGGLLWNGTGSATTRSNLGLSSVFPAPGVNAYTASTADNTIVGVIGSPSFTAVTASNFISGSTNLNQIFAPIGSVGGGTTYVQPGLNITTGGTASLPIVNLVGSIVLTGVTAQSISGTSVSASNITLSSVFTDNSANFATGVYFKNTSNLLVASNRFTYDSGIGLLTLSHGTESGAYSPSGGFTGATLQETTYITPGGVYYRGPSDHLTASSDFTFDENAVLLHVAGTVSAGTYYEGTQTLAAKYAPISVVPTYVQPGTNITTGGTASAPTVNLVASPSVTNLVASGTVDATVLSGDSHYQGSDLQANIRSVRLTGDTSTSSATFVDATGLSFSVEANASYSFVFHVVFQSNNAGTGAGWSINGPASPTLVCGRNEWVQSAGNAVTFITGYDTTVGVSSVPNINTNYMAIIQGTFINGANSGTLQLRYLRAGAANTITLKAGSSGTITKTS